MRTTPVPRRPDVVRREHEVDQRRLDQIVVVAPDDAFLVGVHRSRPMPRSLGLVGPLRCLAQLGDRNAGDPRCPPRATACWPRRPRRIPGVLRDELVVVPALLDDVGEERVEQRDVGAGLDVEVQDVVLAGDLLCDRYRRRAPRIDEDDPRLRRTVRWGTASSSWQPSRPAGSAPSDSGSSWSAFRRVAADRDDHVGQLRVLVAVVEFADAHLAGGVALGVVGGAVVDAHHRRLQCA